MIKKAFKFCLILFFFINSIAFFHAYKFTHFCNQTTEKRTKNAKQLSGFQKIKTLVFGINNPKPTNTNFPIQPYKTIYLSSNKKIECWEINSTNTPIGTVLIFHGYHGSKSMMLDKSNEFIKLGYNILLVDFMGSGGSNGNQTTIGYKEAKDVKVCFDYIKSTNEKNITLMGTSMGAAAILRAISVYNIQPQKIILECPFGSMYTTTCARFKLMKTPPFPLAAILLFWGSVQNGFWTFSHNPQQYATAVNCPTLLLQGGKDAEVSMKETNTIYKNLSGKKKLISYTSAAHENYFLQYKTAWIHDVSTFLKVD